nr:putative reverse transcriptase domain-containing protein [Tanacetum cinerariifolium]
ITIFIILVWDVHRLRDYMVESVVRQLCRLKLGKKRYADKRRKPLECSVGDYVLLKASPWKGVVRFGKKGKLAPRFVRPFEIIKKVGPVAYRLDFVEKLNGVHDTFYVSNLKKRLADPTPQVPLDGIRVDAKLSFVKEPMQILDREFKKLKRSRIAIVKFIQILYCVDGAPRFVRPFEIIKKVGPVAYQLDFLEKLNGVHDTFYVSNLNKRLADPTPQVPLDGIRVNAKLSFVKEPMQILDREFKKLKRSRIAIVKVRIFLHFSTVLFTETECLVLSPDFKLLDESQVLLKVPRQNNMYIFDLKNVVLSRDLTCLFAKATIDESILWHRRLGNINFKTLNKLVRGNLVRGLPSKNFENDHSCVTCKKG